MRRSSLCFTVLGLYGCAAHSAHYATEYPCGVTVDIVVTEDGSGSHESTATDMRGVLSDPRCSSLMGYPYAVVQSPQPYVVTVQPSAAPTVSPSAPVPPPTSP